MKLSRFHITTLIAIIILVYLMAGVYNRNYSWMIPAVVFLLYIIILVAGSIFIRLNFYLISRNRLTLNHIPENARKKVAITFDDGPSAYTGMILDLLKAENVTATFFLIGKNIMGNELILKRMQEEGHSIGNHSYGHGFNFDWQSSRAMQEEIEKTSRIIYQTTGNPVTLFRPPYGVTNPNLAKAIKQSGMQSVGWSLRSMDTVAKSEQKLLHKILSRIKDGDIILMHDSCSITAGIMPQLIMELKQRNYEFTAQIE